MQVDTVIGVGVKFWTCSTRIWFFFMNKANSSAWRSVLPGWDAMK
jgi:hypothetical protein